MDASITQVSWVWVLNLSPGLHSLKQMARSCCFFKQCRNVSFHRVWRYQVYSVSISNDSSGSALIRTGGIYRPCRVSFFLKFLQQKVVLCPFFQKKSDYQLKGFNSVGEGKSGNHINFMIQTLGRTRNWQFSERKHILWKDNERY